MLTSIFLFTKRARLLSVFCGVSMPLSNVEIKNLIDKLRTKFDEYAFTYSPKYFDRGAFESRLKFAETKKMNLEAFILAEITNFEKIKSDYEKKQGQGEVSRKIDNLIEAQMKAVAKYPSVRLHHHCGVELPHFVGGVNVLLEEYLPVLWLVLSDNSYRDDLNELEQKLSDFALFKGAKPPKKCEDLIHLFTYAELKDVEIEKIRNNFMKECAFLLHDALDFCVKILEIRNSELDQPVRFDKMHQSAERRKKITEHFSGRTGYGCALKINEYIDSLISDFRLGAFRRRS